MRRFTTFVAVAVTAYAPFAVGADQNVPAPSVAPVPQGTYTVDKAHTSLIFRVSHLGFSTFTGRFTKLDAKLDFDPARLASSRVNVTIDPRSIASDNAPAGFLEALSGEAWLNADAFPVMSFRSQSIEATGKDSFRIKGELSLHGVTKPIVLDARYNGGYAGHPFDPQARVGFSAHGSFKRSEFGVSYGVPEPGSSFGVGDEVSVVLESEFSGPKLETVAKN
jgi:polyisoprenoid-binding protein YceI